MKSLCPSIWKLSVSALPTTHKVPSVGYNASCSIYFKGLLIFLNSANHVASNNFMTYNSNLKNLVFFYWLHFYRPSILFLWHRDLVERRDFEVGCCSNTVIHSQQSLLQSLWDYESVLQVRQVCCSGLTNIVCSVLLYSVQLGYLIFNWRAGHCLIGWQSKHHKPKQ